MNVRVVTSLDPQYSNREHGGVQLAMMRYIRSGIKMKIAKCSVRGCYSPGDRIVIINHGDKNSRRKKYCKECFMNKYQKQSC